MLVIDDELGPRESLRMLFKESYDVVCAASGDEGVAALKARPADIIILDLKMPGKSGLDTLGEIRTVDEKVPVVILTGYGTIEAAKKAMHLGAIEFLSKPFDTAEMEQIVATAIEKHNLRKTSEDLTRNLLALNERLTEQTRHLETLATVGQLSAEILHEINNPLTVIQGYAQLLLQELADDGDARIAEKRRYLTTIGGEITRCKTIAENVLRLARPDGDRSAPVDIGGMLSKAIEFFAGSHIARRIRFRTVLPERLPPVRGDADQLHQAFANIMLNAIQALDDGGEIVVSAAAEPAGVRVTIRDNGKGIPAAVLGSIFEPFVSTKKSGGTGLGLTIARKIARKHGGDVTAENPPGGGAAFHVVLPAAAP